MHRQAIRASHDVDGELVQNVRGPAQRARTWSISALGAISVAGVTPSSSPAWPHGKLSPITCFELIEHTVSSATCLNDVAAFLVPGGCLVFSQALQPADIEVLYGSWWNIGPRTRPAERMTQTAPAA